MAGEEGKELDLRGAIERGTQRTTLGDLEKKGVKNVKILDEKALQELVEKAVDRVVSARTQTVEEREQMLAESRRVLDRLMKEHKAARTRAQLLESDKNELIEQVESLQKELSLQAELEEENLQKKFLEGTASMEKQVEDLRAKLNRELLEERSKVREADQARRDAVAQVLKLQHDGQATSQELKTLKEEIVRQRAEITRLKETGGAAEADKKAREAAEHSAWMLETRLADLQRQYDTLEADARKAKKSTADAERLAEELKGEQARAEAFKARAADAERLRAELEKLEKRAVEDRNELEKIRQAAAVDSAVLKERVLEVEHLKAKVIEEHDRAEALAGLRDELERTRRTAAVDAAVLKERALEAEHLKAKVLEEHDRAEAHKERELTLRAELDKAVKSIAEASALEAETRTAEADRRSELERQLAAERVRAAALEGRLAAATTEAQTRGETARRSDAERNRLARELESLRQELSSAIARQAEREKEAEERRESAVVVAAEIQKIEDVRHEEQKELERLRAEVAALRAHEQRLQHELGEARIDIRSLYEIVAREQGLARSAQDESVNLHAKALDIQGQVGGLKESLAELRGAAKPDLAPVVERLKDALAEEKESAAARLKEALAREKKAAEAALAKEKAARAAALEKEKQAAEAAAKEAETRRKALAAKTTEVAKLETELRRAASSAPARKVAALEAALARAKAAKPSGARKIAELEQALARAKKKKAPAGGVGLDGRGLLEDFLRRVQLKELFQKHVPVAGKNGKTHPSETLQEVVEAAAAGPRAAKTPEGSRLEVFGAPGKPTLDELKAFQSRLAPRAVRQIERVHDGLRHQLVPLPPKGERLVLDLDMPLVEVGKKGRQGAYRPLVCYDGGEFWKARLRSSKGDAGEGVLPFLRECLAKVPRGFARGRVLLRLDERFFSEPVLRFLDRSGAGYVMPAPDTKEIRAAAKKAALREISGGWSVGEFELRVHPIRATKGRFVVLRRKSGETRVLLADRKTGPWRAWTALEGRAAVLEAGRGLLQGWAESPLLGKGRRARAAAFTNHLLASDLLQWFKRAGLPPSEQGRSQESLRKDVLLLAPPDDKRRESTVLVLPKKDGRRRLYRKVAERLGRLRTSAPFKLGR